jgi:hypothetical protein
MIYNINVQTTTLIGDKLFLQTYPTVYFYPQLEDSDGNRWGGTNYDSYEEAEQDAIGFRRAAGQPDFDPNEHWGLCPIEPTLNSLADRARRGLALLAD